MTDTKDWTFTGFGEEFDDHVARHLPGYADVQRLVTLVAAHTVPDGGVLADLGCSTGASVETIAKAMALRRIEAYLYDADPSMIDAASKRLTPILLDTRLRIAPLVTDLVSGPLAHEDADLTLCLWTLQFIHPREWLGVLTKARQRARLGSVLLVAAKTTHPVMEFQRIAVAALDDYKRDTGVSADERAEKSRALRGVLHEATPEAYAATMQQAGWADVTVLWRWHVWTVFAAHAH